MLSTYDQHFIKERRPYLHRSLEQSNNGGKVSEIYKISSLFNEKWEMASSYEVLNKWILVMIVL